MSFGFTLIRPDGSDGTAEFVLADAFRRRHESAFARRWCRTVIRYERIRRERLMDPLLRMLP